MNKRHENLSAQANKQNIKEVRISLNSETIEAKSSIASKSCCEKESCGKKTSKRTSPNDSLSGSSPSHPHKEGSRWNDMLQKQTTENNLRMNKQADKHR